MCIRDRWRRGSNPRRTGVVLRLCGTSGTDVGYAATHTLWYDWYSRWRASRALRVRAYAMYGTGIAYGACCLGTEIG
eukprot:874465-Rhodomonas_salina.1